MPVITSGMASRTLGLVMLERKSVGCTHRLPLSTDLGWFPRRSGSSSPAAAVENPAAKPGTAVSPAQKFIEVAGVRFVEDPKNKEKTVVRFLLVNHSSADWMGLKGNVSLWGSTQRSEEDAQGSFAFTTDLKPFTSLELTAPLDTKKKIYELADWQNLTTDLQITAPTALQGAQ